MVYYSLGLHEAMQDAPDSPAQVRPASHAAPAASKRRAQLARRHQDGFWTWSRTLSFLTSDEVQNLPKDIQQMIKSYLQDNTDWV